MAFAWIGEMEENPMRNLLKTTILSFIILCHVPVLYGMNNAYLFSSAAPSLLMLSSSYQQLLQINDKPSQKEKGILAEVQKKIPEAKVIKKGEMGLLYKYLGKKYLGEDQSSKELSKDIEKSIGSLAYMTDIISENNICSLIKEILMPSALHLWQLDSLRIKPTTGNLVYVDVAPYLSIQSDQLRNELITFDSDLACWHKTNSSFKKMIVLRAAQITLIQAVNSMLVPLIKDSVTNFWMSSSDDTNNKSTIEKSVRLVGYITGWIGTMGAINWLGNHISQKLLNDKTQDNNLLNTVTVEQFKNLFKKEIENLPENFNELYLKIQHLEQIFDTLTSKISTSKLRDFDSGTYMVLYQEILKLSSNYLKKEKEILDIVLNRLNEKHNFICNYQSNK